METQGLKILFIIVGLAILAMVLGIRKPVNGLVLFGGTSDNPRESVLGESTVPADVSNGPAALVSNVPMLYPPPLMSMNPVTSTQTGC